MSWFLSAESRNTSHADTSYILFFCAQKAKNDLETDSREKYSVYMAVLLCNYSN